MTAIQDDAANVSVTVVPASGESNPSTPSPDQAQEQAQSSTAQQPALIVTEDTGMYAKNMLLASITWRDTPIYFRGE